MFQYSPQEPGWSDLIFFPIKIDKEELKKVFFLFKPYFDKVTFQQMIFVISFKIII